MENNVPQTKYFAKQHLRKTKLLDVFDSYCLTMYNFKILSLRPERLLFHEHTLVISTDCTANKARRTQTGVSQGHPSPQRHC